MNKLNNISIVLPIHKIGNEEESNLLLEAIKSTNVGYKDVIASKLLLVYPKGETTVKEFLKTNKSFIKTLEIEFIEVINPNDSNFQSQVNYAVSKITTDYFCILDFDDVITQNWFYNVEKYITKEYYSDISCFLPIIAEVVNNNQIIRYSNEAVYSNIPDIDEEGFLTNELLTRLVNFSTNGAIFNTKEFIEVGGLKENIKLSFCYELLLRLTNRSNKVFTIPKIGYIHRNNRVNSLFYRLIGDNLSIDKLSKHEFNFWMETAKKESYFTESREIIYDSLSVETE
jgi:hypothetical protein